MTRSNKRRAAGRARGTNATAPRAAAAPPEPASEQARHAAALRASIDVPEGSVPQDRGVFRLMLARRMMTFMRLPPLCGEPRCRRTGRCVGPTMRCQRDIPPPPMTPEEREAAIADFRDKLVAEARRRGLA